MEQEEGAEERGEEKLSYLRWLIKCGFDLSWIFQSIFEQAGAQLYGISTYSVVLAECRCERMQLCVTALALFLAL